MTKAEFLKLFKKVKLHITHSDQLKFLGYLTYKYSHEILTPFTDYKRICYLVHEKLSWQEITGLACHEVMHILSFHKARQASRDGTLWNLACDHVINRVLRTIQHKVNASCIKMPDGGVFFEDKNHNDLFPKESAEEIYNTLMKGKKAAKQKGNGTISIKIPANNNHAEGEFTVRTEEIIPNSGLNIIILKDENSGKEFVIANDLKTPAGVSQEDIQKASDELMTIAKRIYKSDMIDKGDMPGDFRTFLEDLFKFQLPWEEVLRMAILYWGDTPDDVDWTMPNIYMPDYDLPYYVDGMETKTAVLVIDTSGSIASDEEDMRKFLGITLDATEHFRNLRVLLHDSEIYEQLEFFDKPDESEILQKFRETGFQTGGTSHVDCFNRIEEFMEDDEISSIIFMTDFYSDVEQNCSRFDFFKQIPTIWVLNHCGMTVDLPGCDTQTIHLPKIEK